MLKYLGQSEYGVYNFVSSLISYLALLSFGFTGSYMRFYSRFEVNKDSENIAKLNGMFLMLFTFMGVLSIAVGIILLDKIEEILGSKFTIEEVKNAKQLIRILLINVAISFPATVFDSIITAHERFLFLKSLQIIKTVLSPLLTIPLLINGYGSVSVVFVTTLVSLLVSILSVVFSIKKLKAKFVFHGFEWSLLIEVSKFSFYIFVFMIVDQINWNVDRIIVGRVRGAVEVAKYGLGSQLNTYYLIISSTLSSLFIPRVNKIAANEEDSNVALSSLFIRVGRIQFILLFLIATILVFFGVDFINLWVGNEYTVSYYVSLLLILPVTVPAIQNLGIEIQKAKNLHQFRAIVYLLIAILNVVLSIPLTIKWGGVGAALGTAISLVLGNGVVMNIYYNAKVGLDISLFWKNILSIIKAVIIPILIGALLSQFVTMNSWGSFIWPVGLYVFLYILFMWKNGFTELEKKLFIKGD